jgi:hypothetical protein
MKGALRRTIIINDKFLREVGQTIKNCTVLLKLLVPADLLHPLTKIYLSNKLSNTLNQEFNLKTVDINIYLYKNPQFRNIFIFPT